MKQYTRVIDVIRERHVPDPRAGVFDVAVEQR